MLAHFIVSDDVERSRRFYTRSTRRQGGLLRRSDLCRTSQQLYHHQCWGSPTDDKPEVTLETPRDPNRVSSFLNIRVADIQAVYAEWSARGPSS